MRLTFTNDNRWMIHITKSPWELSPRRYNEILSLPLSRSYEGPCICYIQLSQRDHQRVIATARAAGCAIDKSCERAADAASDQSGREDGVGALGPDPRTMPGLERYGYQDYGVSWLQEHQRSLLADDTGTGKSCQILGTISTDGALVVCPASVKRNWAKETRMWRTDLTPSVINGRRNFRWPKCDEIVIANYDLLPDAPPPLPNNLSITLVADEAHALKNLETLRTTRFMRATHRLRQSPRSPDNRIIGATATPMPNRPSELGNVLEALDCMRDSFGARELFDHAFVDSGKPRRWMHDILHKVMLRRTKAQVLPELPGRTFRMVEVDVRSDRLRSEMDRAYDALEAYMRAMGDGEIGNLPAFFDMSRVRREIAEAKIGAMLGLIEDLESAGEPVVVFSDHREPVLRAASRSGWTSILGGLSDSERFRRNEAFQAGHHKGIACTITAAGAGINLFRASHMIVVDLNWVPAHNTQAFDRIHRNGQKDHCMYTILCLDHPLDRRIAELNAEKEGLSRMSITESPGGMGAAA